MSAQDIDLSQYSVYPATEEQTLEVRTRGHAQWGGGMDLQDFLGGYGRLCMLEHAADGRLTTWYRRDGFAIVPGQEAPHEETVFGVAAVYTPPRFRRKGAARRMMQILHYVLARPELLPPFPAAWGAAPNQFPEGHKFGIASVLYSAIGADFYRKCGPTDDTDGWKLASPVTTKWDVSKAKEVFDKSGAPNMSTTILGIDDLDPLWTQDGNLMRSELAPSTTATVTFPPWRGVGAALARRNALIFSLRGKEVTEWGARLSGESEGLAFVTWTPDLVHPENLGFTRIRASSPEQFRALLYSAVQTASANGHTIIDTWNLPGHLLGVAAEYGGQTERRPDQFDSIAWYGPGDSVEWVNDER
ncbi:hypothetical protein AURDEDRAFT_125582 [Auricularia subglabra TFB-10046 SS5]|nr:hypothetical protein AURDEDRAFT_125582 [Auricularia subglabra TFB-10046 SS5]